MICYLTHADVIGRFLGRMAGVPRIISFVRSSIYYDLPYIPLFIIQGLTSFLTDLYLFNSPAVALVYKKYFFLPDYKIRVIPNGIDLYKYSVRINKKLKLKSLGLPSNKKYIGIVSNLRPVKGYKYLLAGFADVLRTISDSILVIIGSGPYENQIRSDIKNLHIEDKVFLLGNRSDIPEILKTFDVFVFPSLHESMSNAVLEAMASDIPIVASDIAANRLLLKNGVDSILVPPADSGSIGKALIKLLSDNNYAGQLAKNAFKKTKGYSYKSYTNSLTEIL
jgi:glycosyltransferase involved in cell wall biosynthesis